MLYTVKSALEALLSRFCLHLRVPVWMSPNVPTSQRPNSQNPNQFSQCNGTVLVPLGSDIEDWELVAWELGRGTWDDQSRVSLCASVALASVPSCLSDSVDQWSYRCGRLWLYAVCVDCSGLVD